MSGQFTSRDILAFSMYEELQVSKYLNGFYDYLFLNEYDSMLPKLDPQGNQSSTTNKSIERYIKEFKKTSEEPDFDFDHSYKLFSEMNKESYNEKYTEESHNSYNTVLPNEKDKINALTSKAKQGEALKNLGNSILYLLFNKYKKYNIISHLNDPTKLIVIPDYYESNTTTLKEYFNDINIKDKLKNNIHKDLKDRTANDNIFFLKVLMKNDINLNTYKTIINEEFKRLDSFLQQQFAKAISNLSRPTGTSSEQINPFKEIILLVNNKGEITYEYYKSNTIKTTKYLDILNTELNKYLNDNKNKNINIGIQNKKINNKVYINPFFSLNFKQINNENSILKIIKSNINDSLAKFKNDDRYSKEKEAKIKKNFLNLFFVFFTLNEIYKEFFDKTYLKNQLTLEDEKKEIYLKVFFRYNILNDGNEYDLKKIVFNTSYKCQLEIDELPNYKISGHFKSKGKFYNFKVTYIDPIDLKEEANKELLVVLFEKIKNFSEKTPKADSFFKAQNEKFNLINDKDIFLSIDIKSYFKAIAKLDYDDFVEHIDKIEKYSSSTDFDDVDKKYYVSFTKIFDTITDNNNTPKSIQPYKNRLNSARKILERLMKLPNYKEIMFFILNGNEIKLRINKKNNIFNFSVLKQAEEEGSSVFQDKFYGILKKYKTTHYYEPFSLNRINNTLSENKKIYFYEDLYITKDILVKYLKSINDYDEKVKPRKQLPYKLLKILSNNVSLNELFLYIYDNNRSNVYIDESESLEERNKANSNFNLFKMKAIKGLINIIFTKGTPFYISRIQKDNRNSTSKINYAAYTIDKINNLNYITNHTRKEEYPSFTRDEYFYSSVEDSKQLLRQYDSEFSNNEETSTNSILYKKNKKDVNRFVSKKDYEEEIKKLISNTKKNENKTIVVLDFDLISSNLVGKKQSCKTRKKRIGNKLWSLFNKQLQKANIFTRKLKNKLKSSRKRLLKA